MDVLFITVDSLRYDALFDGDRVRSDLPAIARLAGDGTVFTQAFANAAYTAQSFRSILGGTYPWMYGTEDKGFQPARPHLAEELQAAGYTTAGFHSNPHLAPLFGYDRGFDFYLGREDTSEESTFQRLQTTVRQLVPEDSRTFRTLAWAYKTAGSKLGVQLGGRPYVPGETLNGRVFEWARTASRDAPRFVWVHYMDVHNPYYPHSGTPSEDIPEREAIRLFHTYTTDPDSGTAADVETLRRLYEGEIRYLDDCIGSLLDGLGVSTDETLVVLASDHGDAFGEHGRFFHPGILYDELVHVPLVIAGPGFNAADSVARSDVPASNLDLMPTLLSAVGAHVPEACSGDDLGGLLVADPSSPDLVAADASGLHTDTAADPKPDPGLGRQVFAHAQSQDTGKAMVTTGRWKLLRDLADDSDQLFDRHADPDERVDRLASADSEAADAYRVLRDALDEHVASMRAHDGDGDAMHVEVPDDVADRLRQLGYTE